MKLKKSTATTYMGIGLLLSSTILTAGCERKGPVERAGEKIDRAVDDVKDAIDPPGPAEKAGKAIDRAVDDVKR
jgi:hypothetical protein